LPINFLTLLGRSGVVAIVIGALAAAVSVYAADARAASSAPPYAAIVLDANSGKVLHSANADELCHPASLTKIMTLYLLFERLETGKLRLDTQLPVSEHAAMQAAPVINRFTDAFAVWNDYQAAAVPGANAAAQEARAFAAISRLSLWSATALSGVARDISSCPPCNPYAGVPALPFGGKVDFGRARAFMVQSDAPVGDRSHAVRH
jgi:hypothetical protein